VVAVSQGTAPRGKDDFGARIVAAQRDIATGINRAGLQRDPYGEVLTALSTTIGILPDLVQHLEATRQPVQNAELRDAVKEGVKEHAGQFARSTLWRTALLCAGLVIAGLGVGCAGGYLMGYRSGQVSTAPFSAMSPADASAWLSLMAANPANIGTSAKDCQEHALKAADGRRVCELPIWLDRPVDAPRLN
jgi:hypothetical protein